MKTFRNRLITLGALLALSGLFATSTTAQETNFPGVNTGQNSPTCTSTAHGTTIQWRGNQVLSLVTDGRDLTVKQVVEHDAFGDGFIATITLPACNIGFTPDFDATGCTTAPIALHGATAGMNPKGPAAINAMNSQTWKYFAGFKGTELGTILFRTPCPTS